MAEIKAKSISEALGKKLEPDHEADLIAAKVCYYYPRYSLYEARRLPHKVVRLLLKAAEREKAAHYFALTQIVAAPHTKDGAAVKSLSDKFKEIMDS